MISSLLYFVYNVFHDDEGHKLKCVGLTIKVVLFITSVAGVLTSLDTRLQ